MCTDGQPRTSCPKWAKSSEQSTGRASVLSPRTSVLICVLMDSHRRPSCVCANGHTRTRTDSHGRPVCTEQTAHVAKITQTVHRKDQRAESKDQRAEMCTDGQPQTSCVLTDTHGQPQTSCVC
ncbi:unnamed protein product [Brassica rapa]|uniref:Uncharacterized protein n=1 Tax=Brassica campestris TaxID=3711 RepID=A0A8D9CT46_BRACM|nr:unnamed protein product [Brassica rapa]